MSEVVRLPRDVVRVQGPDAASYLQGQLSQDVEALAVGSSAFTLLLEPDGKLGFWLRISRTADDTFVLDLDAGHGGGLVARLERFKLRVDASVEPIEWSCVRVLDATDAPAVAPSPAGGGVEIEAAFAWGPLRGIDLIGPTPDLPADARELTVAEYESRRIVAGWPTMGAEITEGRIPAETGVVESSVSFTKGCYTGQELVARVDSRGGNVPRHLRRLVVDGPPPPSGTEVVVDDEAVGEVTSAAVAPDDAASAVALAYVKRSVEVPAAATVAGARATVDGLMPAS